MDRKTKEARHTLIVLPCFAIGVTAVVHAGSRLAIIPVCIVRCWTQSHSPFKGWTQNMYECFLFFVSFWFILLLLLFVFCLSVYWPVQTKLSVSGMPDLVTNWAVQDQLLDGSLSAVTFRLTMSRPFSNTTLFKCYNKNLTAKLAFIFTTSKAKLTAKRNKQNPDNSLKNSQSLVFTAADAYIPFARIFLSRSDCVSLMGRQNSGSDSDFVACCKSVVILCVLWLGPHIYDDA